MVRLGSDKSNNQIMMPHKFCILNSNLLIKRLLKSSDYLLVEAVQITVCQLHVKHEFLLFRNLMFWERLNLALNLYGYRWIIISWPMFQTTRTTLKWLAPSRRRASLRAVKLPGGLRMHLSVLLNFHVSQEAAGHEGGKEVGPCHWRSKEAPPLQAWHCCPEGD